MRLTLTAAQLYGLSAKRNNPPLDGWEIGEAIIQDGWDTEQVLTLTIRPGSVPMLCSNSRAAYLALHGAGAMEIPVDLVIELHKRLPS